MAPKQRHRTPKLKTAQDIFQERTSSATLEPIALHKEDQAVEEKQSYAMITGLLQVLVHMHCPRLKRPPLTSPFAIKVASIAYQRYVTCAIGLEKAVS